MQHLGRLAAVAAISVTAVIAILSIWSNLSQPRSMDFIAYWAAGRMVLTGEVGSVYDIEAHRQVERTVAPISGLMPFPYPPAFLLVVTPFGLLPFTLAFPIWILASALLFLLSTRNRAAAAHPSAISNVIIGQTGFLATATLAWGSSLVARRPFAGGAVLGLMALKPQLALLIPFALLAGRLHRSLAGAAASVLGLTILSIVLFGTSRLAEWLHLLGEFSTHLGEGAWPWTELASPYALFRWFGANEALALVLHGAIAASAAAVVWLAWSRDMEGRVPMLAAATLLIPPYLLNYDTLLLALPFAWLATKGRGPAIMGALWILAGLPVAAYFGLYAGPNTLPLAAVLSIIACCERRPRPMRRTPSS